MKNGKWNLSTSSEASSFARSSGVAGPARKEDTTFFDTRPENFQFLSKSIIGNELPMQHVIQKLHAVASVGIVGMGGSGKTKLAMAIFNKLCQNFEYSCFVHGMNFIKGNSEGRMNAIWRRMHRHGQKVEDEEGWTWVVGKKLLLVMDDAFTDSDLEALSRAAHGTSSGSRFIVTSRDKLLLNKLDEVYEIPLLEESTARQLFLSHAFPEKQDPARALQYLVETIVSKCDGLPLTLEVMGKFLCKNANVEYWQQTVHALVNADSVSNLDERLWAKLRISYDRLNYTEKQFFLDATTFFSDNQNWTLRDAKAAWRMAYSTKIESLLWQTLVDFSLVYDVKENESIKIHKQLQSLGRKIASERDNNAMHRIWETGSALELLQNTSELDN